MIWNSTPGENILQKWRQNVFRNRKVKDLIANKPILIWTLQGDFHFDVCSLIKV